MSPVVELACELIRRKSVTPDDGGIIAFLVERLTPLGFDCIVIEREGVTNLWATHGAGKPHVCLAGHCDVVPPGTGWNTDPFEPMIRDGVLYGRGAADMKGSLASLILAAENVAKEGHQGTISLLVTSDEEGPGVYGTAYALEQIQPEIDFAIVGEPTSEESFGDTIKVGRRGSVNGTLTVFGKQGHVAYPHLADNPIHTALPFLNELVNTRWDEGNEFFEPTSFQISNINSGTGASNVIPGSMSASFNLRYSPLQTFEGIVSKVEDLANSHDLKVEWKWSDSARPFLTHSEELIAAVRSALEPLNPKLGTGGGTSDARCFAAKGIPVIEFGPLNTTIHSANEQVRIEELESCFNVYKSVVGGLLSR